MLACLGHTKSSAAPASGWKKVTDSVAGAAFRADLEGEDLAAPARPSSLSDLAWPRQVQCFPRDLRGSRNAFGNLNIALRTDAHSGKFIIAVCLIQVGVF